MLKNYFVDPFGVIHQQNIGEFSKDYASQYNSYGELSNYMAYLRYGYIMGVVSQAKFFKPSTILDIGYGNGAFLSVCQKAGMSAFGYDVSDTPVPEGCTKIDTLSNPGEFDIITMFDSLEHFRDLNTVYYLPARWLFISVPNCVDGWDDYWFESWKHRRPDEHLHHFNATSLRKFVTYEDRWKYVTHSYIEDVIRKSDQPRNILTMVFTRDG